ncbi:MAG: glycosyltransferase 87 family protein [Acidobacteriaceae bacterium]
MSTTVRSTRSAGLSHLFAKADWAYVLASLSLQLLLGTLFGHLYDTRIFMATGYLVATGQDPYIPLDLTQVFHNPLFQGMTSIGYPPPWALILGGIYLISYNLFHSFLLYNLAIKLPIILANLGLAYLVRNILQAQGIGAGAARKAWVFLLFNPFVLYFTTAWGQFDSLVALLTLASLALAGRQRLVASPILMALAISLKPTPVPVVLALVIFLWGKPWKRLISYLAILLGGIFLFCVAPFFIFHWDASPIFQGWNAQFTVSGGMSLTTLYELVNNTYTLSGNWWLLGIAWLPLTLAGAWLLPRRGHRLVDLVWHSLVLTLIFFLTRTWLSEQNLSLILPLVLILVMLGELPRLALAATWILPLFFTIFNTSPPQLLFPFWPQYMSQLLQWMDTFRSFRLVARMLMVIPWQMAGWWMVISGFRRKVVESL